MYVESTTASLLSKLILPLAANPVTVNNLADPTTVFTYGTSGVATVSISDAFGIYDLQTPTITSTISGLGIHPINGVAMTAASGNTAANYTGYWTYTQNPSTAPYSTYSGTRTALASGSDNSGNSYSSNTITYSYDGSQGSGQQGGTTTAATTAAMPPLQGLAALTATQKAFILVIILVVVLIGVIAVIRKRNP